MNVICNNVNIVCKVYLIPVNNNNRNEIEIEIEIEIDLIVYRL